MIQRCSIFFIAFVLSNSICFADDGFFGGSDFGLGSTFDFSFTGGLSGTTTDFGSLNYTYSNYDFSGSGSGGFGDFNYSQHSGV